MARSKLSRRPIMDATLTITMTSAEKAKLFAVADHQQLTASGLVRKALLPFFGV